jgi:hypothetical protein
MPSKRLIKIFTSTLTLKDRKTTKNLIQDDWDSKQLPSGCKSEASPLAADPDGRGYCRVISVITFL